MPSPKPTHNDRNHYLEKKVLLRYIPAAAVVTLLYCVYDFAAGDVQGLTKAVFAIAIFGVGYIVINVTDCSAAAKRGVLISFILMVSAGFFNQGGLRGINALDFFNLVMVLAMVTTGREKHIFFSVVFLVLSALTWIEIERPDCIIDHELHHPVWFDMLEILFRILTTLYAGYLYKKEFETERAKVLAMNRELRQAHLEIVAYNRQLKDAIGELREQRNKVESMNTELVFERNQTLKANQKLAEAYQEIESKKEQIQEYNLMLERMIEELKEEQQKVLQANRNLEKVNAELNTNNEFIAAMNETLERKVEERTQGIVTMNKKIAEYAFFTSHELRAPLARILGLTQLMKIDLYKADVKQRDDLIFFYVDKLLCSASELDEQVRRAAALLNEVEIEQSTRRIGLNIACKRD
jgi:hypothetical protein